MSEEKAEKLDEAKIGEIQQEPSVLQTDAEDKVSGDESKIKDDIKETEKVSPSPEAPKSRPESKSDKAEGPDGKRSISPQRQSRPTSSDPTTQSEIRPKSSASIEGPNNVKVKKKTKKGELDTEGHEVTFTITISIAIPTGLCIF